MHVRFTGPFPERTPHHVPSILVRRNLGLMVQPGICIRRFHVVKGKVQGRHVENFPTIPTLEGTPMAVDTRSQKPDIVVGPTAKGMQGMPGASKKRKARSTNAT